VKQRIEAALFDFGGVFTDSPFEAFERYGRDIGVEPERVVEIVFGPYSEDTDHPWHRLERGELALGDAREQIMELASETKPGDTGAFSSTLTGGDPKRVIVGVLPKLGHDTYERDLLLRVLGKARPRTEVVLSALASVLLT